MSIRYTSDHERVSLEGEVGTIGISDYAQAQLGAVVRVELPAIGRRLSKGDEAALVESVKAASEVFAPVSGEVIAVNEALLATPGLVNEDAAGRGWFLQMRLDNPDELDELMSADDYARYVAAMS
jgi:glycine cleavage system H protein